MYMYSSDTLENCFGLAVRSPTCVQKDDKPLSLSGYTTAKKKRPNQLGYLVGIWL